MGYNTKAEIMARLKEHWAAAAQIVPEDKIVGIFLQGSQNYNLATPESDIDTKCIVAPSLNDVIQNRSPISTTHVLPNEEHIDFKDIRLIMNNFRKQNINYIEILFTDYCIINPKYKKFWNMLVEDREAIARYSPYAAVKAMKGMTMDKYHALEHPYPNKIATLEKFGYDPKQLHHLYRLNQFLFDYLFSRKTYKEILQCQFPRNTGLILIKKGIYSLEEARENGKALFDANTLMADMWCKKHLEEKGRVDPFVDSLFDKVQTEIIKKSFKKDIRRK